MAYTNDELPSGLDPAEEAGDNDWFVVQKEGENKLRKISRANLLRSEIGVEKGIIQGNGLDPEIRVDFEGLLNSDYIILVTVNAGIYTPAYTIFNKDSSGFNIKLFTDEDTSYTIQYSAELLPTT